MDSVNTRQANPGFQVNKSILIALILVIMTGSGLYAYKAFTTSRAKTVPPISRIISQQTLAGEYGVGVNLVAVTAAGGMVDLRLKIIDGQKAKLLLKDQANFPALRAGNDVVLRASQEVANQEIKFDDGSNIFVLYPNAQNAVKPGDPVSIVFGDIQVEPIQSK